jgi:hypothetical protein
VKAPRSASVKVPVCKAPPTVPPIAPAHAPATTAPVVALSPEAAAHAAAGLLRYS